MQIFLRLEAPLRSGENTHSLFVLFLKAPLRSRESSNFLKAPLRSRESCKFSQSAAARRRELKSPIYNFLKAPLRGAGGESSNFLKAPLRVLRSRERELKFSQSALRCCAAERAHISERELYAFLVSIQ